MQPIKTTNAMNPAPAKGIQSLPTPVIDDVIITETVNAWKGDYQKLEYGTKWDSVPHGSQQGSFPEHKLVFQQTSSEDGQWVKRIWANDRVNQDGYNYAIKYSAGSQEHPIYTRTYVLPRETYAPLVDGTPDPLFPSALLVDEEATRIEGELDSKYITVTRVYETIPGPAVPTRRYNERGDLETVIVQTVPPNTPPDPDGLLVTGSQVEQVETGKGVKTTSTVPDHSLLRIKEKKEGLLGETVTTDDIVDPSTNPDALSQTIVSSVVEQFSATKARKRTTTASGPNNLSKKSKDGKLLGDTAAIQSVVEPNASPDNPSKTILSSEVNQVDAGKAIKTNVVLNSTPTLAGNQGEQGLLGVKTTSESIVPAGTLADALSQTVISSQVEPIDSVRSRKVTVTSTGPTSLSGGQAKDGLLGEVIVTENIVAVGSLPDALSQTVVSSQVDPIDSAKSKKTTVISIGPTILSGGQAKDGLLGETTVSEEIVAAGSLPDLLSQSIISSIIEPIDSAKSKKTTITSIGPTTLSGGQAKDGLLGEVIVSEEIVAAGSPPDALSQSIISSIIEPIDSAKSKKTTVISIGPISLSGGQKKEGLLGEVIVTENIVAVGSPPDALSETVVSSQVDPIDSTKSKKTTITSIGPKSLSKKSNDGKLLGNITSTERVVAPSTSPDAVSPTILSSEVRQSDSGKAIKTNVVLNGTPILSGTQSEQGLLGVKKTTESIVAAGAPGDALSLSVISSQVEPIDSVRSRKVTIESTGPISLFGGQKKEGLLGETTVNESIVAAGSHPDLLSQTVVSSQVDPIDSTKSKKTTVTSIGPTSLTQKNNDGKLLGNITSIESIVAPNTSPDAVSLTILSSEVKQVDSGKAIKRNTFLNSSPKLSSDKKQEGLLGETTITESLVSAGTPSDALSQTVISSTVEPIDSVRSRKITIKSSGPKKLSGGQKKEGLLGETTVSEEIVASGAQPDLLSQTVVSSQVDPIDSAKSKKTTVTSIGPTSLAQKNKDGKLLGDITSTQSVVAPNTSPDNPSTTILSSEVKQSDSGKAIKTNVVLNSTPTLSGTQSEQGLLGVKSTTERIVPAGTPGDALSQTVISSTVEPIDSVRSRKVTVTSIGPSLLFGGQKKEGLLGEVVVIENIVAAGSQPDNLSQSVISSQVDPIDSAKSKKTTITSIGPTILSKKSNDGKLLGDITSTESIVAPSASPDAVSTTILSSEVRQSDSGKAIKTNVVLNGTPILSGTQSEQGLLGVKKTTESIVAAGAPGDALSQTVISSTVEPIDSVRSRKVTVTSLGPTSLSKKSNDGKLLGDITSIESVVAPSTSPDVVSSSVLSSEVRQVDSGKAIKTNIVLNSTPTLSGTQSEQGLLGVKSTTESIVIAGTQGDALSQTVISSQVEPIDSVRSRKVTVTSLGPSSLSGGQKKEGLLGETTVNESIVASGVQPDALSETVVSSQVDPIDSAKSKKTTVISTGPKSLSKKSNDGKLLGNITSTESVVAIGTSPDSVSASVLSSEVRQVDSGKAIKTNVVLNSTPILTGTQSEQGLLGNKQTTETIIPAGTQGDALSQTVISSTVEPIDSARSKKVTIASTGPTSLSGGQKKDGLLGETTVNESIVAAGSPPDLLSQTVVSSQVDPIDSAKSKKTTVTSIGPITLSGKRINERGELESVIESIVAPSARPDADSVNTISSQVEPIDIGKSKKTTITVPSRATLRGGKDSSGLLGRTSVTESIVPHLTTPDQLTWTGNFGIIESSVEPISQTKAKKTTVTSNAQKLTSKTLIESQLGLVQGKIEKSIVTSATQPTTNATTGLTIIKDSINALDSVKSEREKVTVDAWPENISVDYDEQLGIGIYYTETIVTPNEYLNAQSWVNLSNKDYKAIDQWKSLKKEIDITKIRQALLSQYYKISIAVPIKLPDKLKSATAYLANSYGAGTDFNVTQGANTGSYNMSNSGSSKSSWSIGGDIYFEIEDGFDGTVDGFKHIFFLEFGKDGRIQQNELLSTLNTFAQFGQSSRPPSPSSPSGGDRVVEYSATYKKWPYIKTKTENIVLIQGGRSISNSYSKSQSAGINGFASSEGKGKSFDVNVSANSINVPKTIHPAITINQSFINTASDTKGIGQPTYGVRPATLPATSPSIFPEGQYLISADVELYKWGFVKVTAITATITTNEI